MNRIAADVCLVLGCGNEDQPNVLTELCRDIFAVSNGFMRAIGYVRVSTDKQADRGVSLEAQQEQIRAMATVHDVELIDIIMDAGESAKDLLRSGMEQVLELVGSPPCRSSLFDRRHH